MELPSNRPDLIFSYWLLFWFFLYIAKIVPYNPLYLFFMGVGLAVIQVSIMVSYSKSFAYIFAFVLANLLIKGIPIYFLYGIKTSRIDLYVILFAMAAYCLYLKMNGINIWQFIVEYLTPSENGRKSFPVTNFIYENISRIVQ